MSASATSLRFTGQLLDADGHGVVGATIALESSTDGVTWVTTGTVQTYSNGWFYTSESYSYFRNTSFRVSYAGAPGGPDPAVSDVVAVTFTPPIAWTTSQPPQADVGQKFPVGVSATMVATSTPCMGVFRYLEYQSGSWVEIKHVDVIGSIDATAQTVAFGATVSLPGVGEWRIIFHLPANDMHGEGGSPIPLATTVGVTNWSISGNKSTVAAGGPVTLTGYLTSAATGKGISGKHVRLQTSGGNNSWTSSTKLTTGKNGKVTLVVHPKSRTSYRFSFLGDTSWQTGVGPSKFVQTIFTLSGTKLGHFTHIKVWMSAGACAVKSKVSGAIDNVWLHNSNDSAKLTVYSVGPFIYSVSVPRAGYYHFKVAGKRKGKYKVQIWN